jgi:hypothetical protein
MTRSVCGIVVNNRRERFYDEGKDIWLKRYAICGRLVAAQPDQIFVSTLRHRCAIVAHTGPIPVWLGSLQTMVERTKPPARAQARNKTEANEERDVSTPLSGDSNRGRAPPIL